jgi:hypothetical protein
LVNRASSAYRRIINPAGPGNKSRRGSVTLMGKSIEGSILSYDATTRSELETVRSGSEYGDDPLSIDDCEEEEDNDEDELFQQEEEKKKSKIKKHAILVEKILESMTVSMIILCMFVLGETFGIVFQMFGLVFGANVLGAILSLFALLVHGANIVASTISLGACQYLAMFKFWLEFAIISVDSAALWFSITGLRNKEEEIELNRVSFIIFGGVVVLHALRVFHMFYLTLKTPKNDSDTTDSDSDSTSDNSSNNKNGLGRSKHSNGSIDILSNDGSSDGKSDAEICSIQGILISRYFSGMRFAAKSLMPPIEEGLSKLFSMEFYGTREKPKDDNHDEEALMKTMMGSGEFKRQSQLVEQNPNDYFHTGRPDWRQIFLKAMAKAHRTNEKGETVGVFFCGAPAIAHDLQVMAKEVTAQHQYAHKKLHGKTCKCKLIVHAEHF